MPCRLSSKRGRQEDASDVRSVVINAVNAAVVLAVGALASSQRFNAAR